MKRTCRYFALWVTTLAAALTAGCFLFPGVTLRSYTWFEKWRADVSTRQQTTGTRQWAYLEGGAPTAETIIFIHGFGGRKEIWLKVLGHFTPRYHVIAPDIPGFGESAALKPCEYRAATLTEYLEEFLKALGLSRFHLLGTSMGAGIAGCYASEFVGKVKSLALVGAAGVRAPVVSPYWKIYRETGENLLFWDTPAKFRRLQKHLYHTPPHIPEPFITYLVEEKLKRLPRERMIFRELIQNGRNVLERRLSEIKAPTLILWGAADQIIDVSTSTVIQRKLENARTVIIEDTGHIPFIEAPDAFCRAYQEFLRSL